MASRTTVRIDINKGGIGELLGSKEVADNLEARGHRMAAAAGGEAAGFEVTTSKQRKDGRSQVVVRTATVEARLAEANDRALSRAIDAGRGV